MPITSRFIAGLSISAIAVAAASIPASASQEQRLHYLIPAQPLTQSLEDVSRRSGRSVVASADLVRDRIAPAIDGEYTLREVVALLLSSSGLTAQSVDNGLLIGRDQDAGFDTNSDEPVDGIIVTGSRIRGATIASPMISISRDDIRNSGRTTIGEIVRNIPQSFGGGQNPGIGLNVPAINGTNVGGGSSINLRGLGSDATLTLLNGKRLGYSGSRQSVDVSTIPIGAVDRIEIVADGASALYGSDAVGGVANILLLRDYDGVETRAHLGGSTEGGNFRQQYGVTGGARWSRGGFVAAYEFNRNTPITSSDRSYATARSPGLTLYPGAHNHNALISAHHQIGSAVDVSIDALFNRRRHGFTYANNPAGNLAIGRTTQATDSRAFSIAPTLNFRPQFGWVFSLTGSFAREQLDYRVDNFVGATRSVLTAGCFCNRSQWIEFAGDGQVARLPAGAAKLAVGAGYRNIELVNDRGPTDPLGFARSQSSRYVYGELDIPVISPGMAVVGANRLSLSAAARNETYDGAGSVTTPKLGVIYEPIPGLEFKASWGRSFRAPTLLQRYQPPSILLLNAGSFGAVGAPAGATALLVQGGRTDLAPEKATSWSVTAAIRPQPIPGLRVEASYFEIDYRDRIVAPIGFTSRSLSDPAFAAFVTRLPSGSTVQALLGGGDYFVNATGRPFNPAQVFAIIDNRSVNAGEQTARGVDILLSYRTQLGDGQDSVTLSTNASHLKSRRQISVAQPNLPLAGILYNPSNWRGRASASWTRGGLTLSGTAHYTGGLSDTRFVPVTKIPPQMRLDILGRYELGESASAWLRGLEVTLGVENLLNAPPPPIVTFSVTDTPYDSTNYSPFGRVLSIGVSKSW